MLTLRLGFLGQPLARKVANGGTSPAEVIRQTEVRYHVWRAQPGKGRDPSDMLLKKHIAWSVKDCRKRLNAKAA